MMDAGIQSSSMLAQLSSSVKTPQAGPTPTATQKAAKAYEGVFVSEFLGSMFQGIPTDGPFGGGQGEEMFRSLMLDEYGKQITARGGFGLSSAITRQLLAQQEKSR